MQTENELTDPWDLLKEFSQKRSDFNDAQYVINQLVTQRLIAYEVLHVAMALKNEEDVSKIPKIEEFWLQKFGFSLEIEKLETYIENCTNILSGVSGVDFRIFKVKSYLDV